MMVQLLLADLFRLAHCESRKPTAYEQIEAKGVVKFSSAKDVPKNIRSDLASVSN
jgi:hypothetical protein